MQPDLLSREEFVAFITRRLRQAGLSARFEAEGFALLVEGGRLGLEQLFERYSERNDPAHREQLVVSLLARLGSPTWEEVQAEIVPRLCSRTLIEESRLHGRPLPHLLLTDNVALTLALDPAQGLTAEHFERWGVPFEVALSQARANLQAATGALPRLLAQGLFAGAWDDANDSARVLLVTGMDLPLKGDPVVFLPTRESLLITGADDLEGLAAAFDRVAGAHGHAITVVPFRWTEGGWTRLRLPPGHPLEGRLRRLTFEDRYQEYAEQKGLLDSIFRAHDRMVNVAACLGHRAGAETLTLTAWVDGVETLLPEADRVMLLPDERMPDEDTVVSEPTWEELRERYADRMEPTEHWPPRWRVHSWR